MPNSNNNCEFCNEFSGGRENSFSRVYVNDPRDRTVLETRHLKILPTLGHFVKGYLLLVPKEHLCAIADAPLELIQELTEIKRSLVRQLSPLYGSYTFFEHGARGPDSGGCGISHAHLHALPLSTPKVLLKLKSQFSHVPVGSLAELKRATSGSSYLYYEDSSSHGWSFFPRFLPSQYMRRLIAEAAGISQWDWRQSGKENELLATQAEVIGALSGIRNAK